MDVDLLWGLGTLLLLALLGYAVRRRAVMPAVVAAVGALVGAGVLVAGELRPDPDQDTGYGISYRERDAFRDFLRRFPQTQLPQDLPPGIIKAYPTLLQGRPSAGFLAAGPATVTVCTGTAQGCRAASPEGRSLRTGVDSSPYQVTVLTGGVDAAVAKFWDEVEISDQRPDWLS